ncbi:hypothetical protein P8452_03612 [Trifolium repens]|nr:hypothetical protein P8452_03612 [Trifolium repens]
MNSKIYTCDAAGQSNFLIAREIYVGNGDMAVIDVMKFVAEHGSKFDHLIRESKLNGQRMDEAHLQLQGRRGCKSI